MENQLDTNRNNMTTITNRNGDNQSTRIYLTKGNLNSLSTSLVLTNLSDHNHQQPSRPTSPAQLPTSSPQAIQFHVYFIIFIGFMPACLGAFAWWIQHRCVKNKCFKKGKRTKHDCEADHQHHNNNHNNGDNIDLVKLSSGKRYGQIRLSPFNIGNQGILLSRPVYSFEVPRKCLELIEILGEGNFGQVWKAKSHFVPPSAKECPQLVAVKTNKLTGESEQQDDLLKELDIMVQLGSHPNVVRLLGCCTENKPYYIVMEFVSQGKLLSYLRRHRDDYQECQDAPKSFITNNNYMTYYPNNAYGYAEINRLAKSCPKKETLSPEDLIHFAYQISKGMEFISSHGIIHRDLAVRNILIDENKNCKVADFGLSRSIRDKDTDMYEMKHGGQVPVRWMSPEALTMGIFSIKSDVWAFGIVLWEIVTLGSTPYIGMSAPEVINYIRQGNICAQPMHCNDDLYDLMKSCWAYKTDDRFTFTQIKYELMKMLLAIQEDRGNYIDLENFNNSLYYYKTSQSTDEKL